MAVRTKDNRRKISRTELKRVRQWMDHWEGDSSSWNANRPWCTGENLFESIDPFPGIARPVLTLGLPSSKRQFDQTWFWWPRGLPPGHSIHVASSRLGRKLDRFDRWFDAIRTIGTRTDWQANYLLTAAGVTSDQTVRRISWLFGIPRVDVQLLEDRTANPLLVKTVTDQPNVFPLVCLAPPDEAAEKTAGCVGVDRLLIEMSDRVFALAVRANGNVYRSLRQRLSNPGKAGQRATRLLIEPTLTRTKISQDLLASGACGWWLYDASDRRPSTTMVPPARNSSPVLSLDQVDWSHYLIHWTRGRTGAWPGEPESRFLDDLVFRRPGRKRDVMAVLNRILVQRKILATRTLTRSSQPVVCFSAVPLNQAVARCEYRRHLGRWDFTSYGIALKRKRLEALGARPVIYGDENVWSELPDSQRPYFQLQSSRDRRIDWRQEREWRFEGDLDLGQFDQESIIVFVGSNSDLNRLPSNLPWRTVCVGSKTQSVDSWC